MFMTPASTKTFEFNTQPRRLDEKREDDESKQYSEVLLGLQRIGRHNPGEGSRHRKDHAKKNVSHGRFILREHDRQPPEESSWGATTDEQTHQQSAKLLARTHQ